MTNLATVSHKDFFNAPAVKARFQEVLHGKENEFVASLYGDYEETITH